MLETICTKYKKQHTNTAAKAYRWKLCIEELLLRSAFRKLSVHFTYRMHLEVVQDQTLGSIVLGIVVGAMVNCRREEDFYSIPVDVERGLFAVALELQGNCVVVAVEVAYLAEVVESCLGWAVDVADLETGLAGRLCRPQ